MDTEQLYLSLKESILKTPAYYSVPSFPESVEVLRTLEELMWWLGITDFSASHLGGDYIALSVLSHLHAQLDSSHAGLMKLISFITNLDTPGYFLGIEQKPGVFPVSQHISSDIVADAIAAVRRRPSLRKAVAQYIIFEDLGCYDTLTLAQLAEQVEKEYKIEFGEGAFVSSTRDVANALASAQTEHESLRKMLTLALEIGTHHIRSRLAVNWLGQVRFRDQKLQQTVDRLKQMTLKAIWQQKMTYSTDDPEFLEILLRGGSFEGYHN